MLAEQNVNLAFDIADVAVRNNCAPMAIALAMAAISTGALVTAAGAVGLAAGLLAKDQIEKAMKGQTTAMDAAPDDARFEDKGVDPVDVSLDLPPSDAADYKTRDAGFWAPPAPTTTEGFGVYDGPHTSVLERGLPSVKDRLKKAGLPTEDKIRFVPEEGYNPSNPLQRGENRGYLDRFGNEWVKGPSRTKGQDFEWDVQLSRSGEASLGWASKDGKYLNVSTDGKVTHK